MRATSTLLLLALMAAPGRTQELLWSRGHGRDYPSNVARAFGDLNGDGCQDLLCTFEINAFLSGSRSTMGVFSGRDGTVLDDNPALGASLSWFDGIGDFDRDGFPDYAAVVPALPYYLRIWSPHRHQQLLLVNNFTGWPVVSLDVDGDGLPDLMAPGGIPRQNTVIATDRFGQTLWSFTAVSLGWTIRDLLAFPDLDGDGVGEIVVGAYDAVGIMSRGIVAVLSGRRGTLMRTANDSIVGDLIGYPLVRAGDVDRDGVEDYATGSYLGGVFSARSVLDVFSGATGARIRQWATPAYDIAASLVGGHDVDLDGVPDFIAGSGGYFNTFLRLGRVQAFSSRDQQLLVHTEPQVDSNRGYYSVLGLADLGVQPGSPYPVVAVWDEPNAPYPYVEVWRLSPPGSAIAGDGCSSTGNVPTISVRRVDGSAGEQSRVVLGSALPGAWAFCVAAGASETTWGGINVPFPLGGLGFASCDLLVPPTFGDQRIVGVSGIDRGYASIDLPFRIDPAGFGAALQWLMLDPSTGNYAATPRFEVNLR